MRLLKKIGFPILMALIALQFIQPARNKSGQVLPADISKNVQMPPNIKAILERSCYDCHSNNTHYPWYSYIQPLRWILENDIRKGKANLNFNDFGDYSLRKQANKLRAISNSIREGTMPLPAYTLIHRNAQLNNEERKQIIDWATTSHDNLMSKQKRL